MFLSLDRFPSFGHQLTTLDLHVAGEPIRLVIEGLPPIPGKSINDKRAYIQENLDHVRQLLTQEPRGHRDMFAGIITEPVSEEGSFGIVFMDARRYPFMCGHGIIGAVTAFVEMSWLEVIESNAKLIVDTPSGPVQARASLRSDGPQDSPRVESVAIQLESAFVHSTAQPLSIPEWGQLQVDVAFAGGYFLMISNDQVGLELTVENLPKFVSLGMAAIEAGNQQIEVQHPTYDHIKTIDVAEFYLSSNSSAPTGKNFVVLGEGHVDRSPCGTGTSARMALLHRRGELAVGQKYINEGLLGTTFHGTIVEEIAVGDIPAIVPEIRGAAHITGLHRFLLRQDDPFPGGFLV